jgi:TetR/AcrR family transcriptional repressor of adeIJK operon
MEWRILMGLPSDETDQETVEYVNYCVDRFLDGHQKV